MWDVYLIADGRPVHVELLFAGSKAKDTIRVTGPVKHDFRNLTERIYQTATHTVYATGDYTKLDEADFGQLGLFVDGSPYAGALLGSCDDPFRDEDEDYPRCPRQNPNNASSTLIWTVPEASAGVRREPFYSVGFPGPVEGIGAWYSTASVVKAFGAFVLWIDFPEVDMAYAYDLQ